MKTKEELNILKEEYEALNKKLSELTEDELKQITGGTGEMSETPEAIIEDVDMAEEATKLTQSLILQQKAQAMLASNKQNKANVLGLLQ